MSRSKSKSSRRGQPDQGAAARSDSTAEAEVAAQLAVSNKLWDRLLFGSLLATLFLLCCFPLVDTDFWWHLKTGELIWQKWEIPRFDWYTYKDADRPWIDLHWGFQLLIAGLYQLGGGNLVILFKAAAYTLTAAIGWKAAGARIPAWLRGLLWVCPLILLAGRAYERPEIMTMLFLACALWILHRVDERPRLIWWLVPLQLVWINFHALSAVGLAAGWAFVAGRVVEQVVFKSKGAHVPASRLTVRAALLAMTAATLAGFLNPYFHQGVFFPEVLLRKFLSEKELYKTIGEFAPPLQFVREHGWTNVNPIALAILTGISAASFIPALLQGRFSTFRFLLLAGFGWLGWSAVRNQNLFGLVAIVVTCGNLDDWSARVNEARPAAGRVARFEVPQVWLSRGMFTLFCVWMFTVVTDQWGQWSWTDGNRKFALGEKENWYAHGAMKFAGQPGLPKFAYVSHGLAPVYIYHNGPDHKVFTDPRLEVASLKTYQEFGAAGKQMAVGDPAWMDTVRSPDGQLPVLVLHRGDKRDFPSIFGIAQFFANRWRLVYVDTITCVFVEEPLAEKLGLRPPG